MAIGAGIGVAAFFVFAIILAGMTPQTQSESAQSTQTTKDSSSPSSSSQIEQVTTQQSESQTIYNSPTGVVSFYFGKDGSIYVGSFALVDKDYAALATDAAVSIELRGYSYSQWVSKNNTSADGTQLYTKTFDVSANDFKVYQSRLGTQSLAYLWQVNGQELQSLDNYEIIKAFLTVRLPGGKTLNTDSLVSRY